MPPLIMHQNRSNLIGVGLDIVAVVDVHYLAFAPDHLGITYIEEVPNFQGFYWSHSGLQPLEGGGMTLLVLLVGLLFTFGVDQKQQFVQRFVNVKIVIPDIRSAVRAVDREQGMLVYALEAKGMPA